MPLHRTERGLFSTNCPMKTFCTDCKKEIPLSEPSYKWRGFEKDIDLCLTCGGKRKWSKLFIEGISSLDKEREDETL